MEFDPILQGNTRREDVTSLVDGTSSMPPEMLSYKLPLMAFHRMEQEPTKTKAIVEEEALTIEEVSVDPPQEQERPKVQLRKSQDTVEPPVVFVLSTDIMEKPFIKQ
ncbi:hypothetical protein DAPPUDRAFT_114803 [Daphnia pulex]|uniref:Uncharacterized protein n=1 Tax=Daphnia pulex TaxID=6669 RepID=E9HJA3_DAPPU|nr:hypothetical protein DAPPUDRAFT_114803 [Daphnia pulex]|eukprot:EFX68136.1 hypothetical protein DAPPUDRAFT_114803 [Daphnia pulex]